MRAISEYKPPALLFGGGYLSEGFLGYEFGGPIFGGAYSFTVLAFITVTIKELLETD